MFKEMIGQAAGDWINWLIIVLFIIVFGLLFSLQGKLKKLQNDATRIYRKTKSTSRISSKSGAMGYTELSEVNPEAMDEAREKFNKLGTSYLSYVQLVSLFPLLGLFGTVYGLIPGLYAMKGGDLETLYAALCTALISTFLGLIAGIVLKFYVSLGPSKTINGIENTLDENDRKYNLLVNFGKVTESSQNKAE